MKLIPTAIALASLLAACGSDGEDTVSTMISATEGGTVEVEGTETRLAIPADSLGEDTEVTVAMASIADYEELEGAIDLVIDLSPPTALSASAALTIDTSDMQISTDAYLSVRQYVDGQWLQPELSSAELSSGGVIITKVSLLAPTAVVAAEVVPTSGN